MPNINTYAKLIAPPMFKPSEQTTFRLQYSEDLSMTYATIKIYGYGLTVNGKNFGYDTVYTQTKYINTSIAGQRYEDFIFNGNTFGENSNTWGVTGIMKASVEISTTENGTPIFKSNEILVDMILLPDNPLYFDNLQASYNSSTVPTRLRYVSSYCLGQKGQGEINSYQITIYDTNDNIIQESEVEYNFVSEGYWYIDYVFYGLLNNTTYKIKAIANLVGGMKLESNTETFSISYSDTPVDNTHILLSNVLNQGCVQADIILTGITHTKYVISRSIKNAEDWLVLYSKNSSSDTETYQDFYALPKIEYTYKLSVYNGTTLVNTYYNNIIHEFDGICIADINTRYCTEIDVEKYPISKNERVSIVQTLDSKYPYGLVNSLNDFESGGISGTFANALDNCYYDYDSVSVISLSFRMLDFLNNGKAKLLKFSEGKAWIVYIAGKPSVEKDNTGTMVDTKFEWTECADATINQNYIDLGLIRGDF